MKTRCPSCQTTFRVTPEQLKARAGKVRCGQCQGVFNALDGLLDDAGKTTAASAFNESKGVKADTAIPPDDAAPSPFPATSGKDIPALAADFSGPDSPADLAEADNKASEITALHGSQTAQETALPAFSAECADAPAAADAAETAEAELEIEAAVESPAPSLTLDTATEIPAAEPHGEAPADALASPSPDETSSAISGESVAETTAETAAEAADKSAADAAALNAALAANLILPRETTEIPGYSKWAEGVMSAPQAPTAPTSHKSFTLIALLLALALAGQIIYHWRGEVALAAPSLRPALEAMTQALGHDIPLPHNADLISIEASDLQVDAAHGKQLILQATLRNRAAYAQAWPLLELSLTDTQDNAIVRRVLQPLDYLPTPAAAEQPFNAGSDLALRLWLEAKEVDAAGYRLYVFYP